MIDLVKALNQFDFIETKYSCYGGHGFGNMPYVIFETDNEVKLIDFIYSILQIQKSHCYWHFIRWFRTDGNEVLDNYKLYLLDLVVSKKDTYIAKLIEDIEKVKNKYL